MKLSSVLDLLFSRRHLRSPSALDRISWAESMAYRSLLLAAIVAAVGWPNRSTAPVLFKLSQVILLLGLIPVLISLYQRRNALARRLILFTLITLGAGTTVAVVLLLGSQGPGFIALWSAVLLISELTILGAAKVGISKISESTNHLP